MAATTTWPLTHTCPHTEDRGLRANRPDLRTGYARWTARNDRTDRTARSHANHTETGDRLTTRQSLERKRGEEPEPILLGEQRAGMTPFDRSHSATGWGGRVRHTSLIAANNALTAVGDRSDDQRAAVGEAPSRLVPRASWSIGNRDSDPAAGAVPVATAHTTSAVVREKRA